MDADADKDLMWIARAGLKAAKSLLSAQPLSPASHMDLTAGSFMRIGTNLSDGSNSCRKVTLKEKTEGTEASKMSLLHCLEFTAVNRCLCLHPGSHAPLERTESCGFWMCLACVTWCYLHSLSFNYHSLCSGVSEDDQDNCFIMYCKLSEILEIFSWRLKLGRTTMHLEGEWRLLLQLWNWRKRWDLDVL